MLKNLDEKKIVITIGSFNPFSLADEDLTFQMRKVAVPNGMTVAFLLSDYCHYRDEGKFPYQYESREKNLKLFVDNIVPLKTDLDFELNDAICKMREDYPDHKIVCVMHDNKKDFHGRTILKVRGVPIKFIKVKYGKKTT